MSIASVASNPNWWYQQVETMQTSQSSSSSSTTGTGSLPNTDTTASPTNPVPFFVDFASDLQAMLAQMSGTSAASGGATNPGAPIQGDATQLVGEAAQALQNPTSGSSNVAAAANTFAADIVQALQAYGGSAAPANNTGTIA